MAKAETIDEELVVGLKMAKTRRCNFALVAKGSNDGALLISKQKIPPVLITAAKKKCGGSGVIKGAVVYEDGKYVFETPKPPAATLPATLKLLARRDAGLTIVAVCRQSTDPEVLAEAGEGEAGAPTGDKSPKDEVHPAVAAEQFRERLKVLMPRYREVLGAGSHSECHSRTLAEGRDSGGSKAAFRSRTNRARPLGSGDRGGHDDQVHFAKWPAGV